MAMKNNGSRTPARVSQRQGCHACGKIVNLQHDNVLVELPDDASSPKKEAIVWHKDCYNQFLDDGEEC